MPRIWPLTGAALLCATTSLSAQAGESAATGPLQEVFVTATRTAMPESRLDVPVIVITREEIDRQIAGDAADLLASQSGVEIARNGGPGQPASVFMRGSESNHTSVLIDGVRMNPGTIGGAALQNVLPSSIERIEIVKGARSALYGTDAIGGVINIITRAGASQGFAASAAASRYGTQDSALSGGADLGAALTAGAAIGFRSSDGFAPQTTATQPRGYDNRSANLRLRYEPGTSFALQAQLWSAAGNSQYMDYDSSFNFGPLDQDYRNAVYALSAELRSAQLQWQTRLSEAEDRIGQNQSLDFAHTRRHALDSQLSWQLNAAQTLTLGAVWTREATQAESFGTAFDVRNDVLQAFAQHQIQHGADEWLLAVGTTHHESFGNHGSWNLEYGRELGAGWRATLATGTAFHAPDSTDRFGYGGNPQLEAEHSRQWDLGLRWQPNSGQRLQLSAFENRIDQLILFELVDPPNFVYRNENVERARIRGLELGYSLQLRPWQLRASATWQQPRNRSSGEPLLRRARRYADLQLVHARGPLELSGELRLSGARYDSNFPSLVRLPGYSLLGFAAAWSITPEWSTQLRIDNALDRDYELARGYNTPGRSIGVAMRYHWR